MQRVANGVVNYHCFARWWNDRISN